MKKLAIIQIILGILIIGSLFVFILLVPGYNHEELIDSEGNVIGFILGLHKLNEILIIWMFIYLALGLAVTGCGIAQLVQTMRNSISKGLTVTQITLGVFVLVSLVVFIIWAEPGWQPISVDGELIGHPEAVMIRHNPDWVVLLIAWKAVSFILGLGVTCCNATQLIKARAKDGNYNQESGIHFFERQYLPD